MTCREFMDSTQELNALELLRLTAEDEGLAAHSRECGACASWLETQQSLAAALQSLSASTAQREASPQVEQAILQAFRTQGFAPKLVEMPKPTGAPLWKLSRVFELGAYAAVAAALIVGVFLGYWILHDRQESSHPRQAQTIAAPEEPESATQITADHGQTEERLAQVEEPRNQLVASHGKAPSVTTVVRVQPKNSPQTSTADNGNYVALMLCDPLICSDEEQVIRMELPATSATALDGSNAGTVLADIVIGEDGLIRGMRIVN